MSENDINKERLELALEAAGLDLWENNLVTAEGPRKALKTLAELGYSNAEALKYLDDFVSIVHPADQDRLKTAVLNHVSGTTEQYRCEFRLRAKDGRWVWYANYGKIMDRTADRPGQRFIGVTFNIDDRKQAEEALLDAKERLALALDASLLSIWELDLDRGLVHFDGAWAEMTDAQPGHSSLGIRDCLALAHPRDARRVVQAVLTLCKGTAPHFQKEFRIRTGNGHWRWIRCSGRIGKRDDHGRALRVIGTNLDITERKTAEEQIHRLAYYDTLTNLPNRRLLMDRLHQALRQAKRFDRTLAVLFLDLDNFKQVNDALGHEAGDQLLQEVARWLEACVRDGDTISRQGGDEFVIVLAEIAQLNDAVRVAQKITQALSRPLNLAGQTLNITTSIGISLYEATADDDVHSLLKKADIAMYAAKKAGRNRYHLYQPADTR